MGEFEPVPNLTTYGTSGFWVLSFFVQLGAGYDQAAAYRIQESVLFSLGSEVSPAVTTDRGKNNQDRVEISFTQPDQQTLEQAIGVGTEAVRTSLETAGVPLSAITSVIAVGYGDLASDEAMARYNVTQKAMEIETAIDRMNHLEVDKF